MSDKSLVDAIKHYQKDIERSPGNAERMLRCLKRLYVMPIKVEHLQLTGVGRSVNNLREASGEVGDAATALVAKWKAMVTAEDMEHEESPAEEEEEEQPVEKSQSIDRVSPDNDRSVKDKENIRLNHRNDKVKNDSSERLEKSEKPYKHSEKDSKDIKSSKHSSREKESSSKKDNSSKNHVSSKETSKDKKDKDKSSEKHKESSKSEHKYSSEKYKESIKSEHKHSSEKDKKHRDHRDDRDKHQSKDKDKHSSRDKEVSKEKDRKHSSSSSRDKHKDKISSSKDRESSKKDKSRERSRDRHEKNSRKESNRSRSHDRSKESRSSEKRKHHGKDRENEKSTKRIKKEKFSSDEEEGNESDAGSDGVSSRNSDSDNEMNHSSGNERTDHSEERSESGSEDASEPESYSKVRIKQEPVSDSGSEKESPPKKSSHRENNHRSSSSNSSKHKTKEEMRPPKTDNLKALIKENEKKIKKEKVDSSRNDKVKKSKIKLEINQDGSIDSGSGASFADALMGFDNTSSVSPKKKKKKEEKPKESSSKLSTVNLGASNVSGHSRSPSQCSTSSYRSTSSPAKQDKKPSIQDISTEAPAALLKKPVKLEPLNLDISSTLPEISTNYKPLPSVLSRHTPTQVMSEEQMFNIMTSKNQRTKVYSGYKYGQTLAVPSLYTFCIQVLYDNIEGLEYTGGVPFEILKPLLIKLNAEQLLSLEHYNPYLVVDTDDLWKFHCKKTFPKGHRDDMETWREVYLRCMDERELKLKQLTANITESMAIKGPARQAKLAYVDSVAKPPRSIARKQVKFGTGTGSSSPVASTSSTNISQIAAAQNQAKKKEIVSKAVVGGFTPAAQATEQVPGFSNPSAAAKILKKKKAPLMAKALQLIKGNRFKR